MISAGSRDGRKLVGIGFDVARGSGIGMEDAELEEGEACSFRNDEEGNIDPDDLTYIDEKLQNVLGHFKKDFEGGVFTENLGAKYGGYGSFLVQRSPVRSYSRSPANVQNSHAHKSPASLSTEGGSYSSLAQSNGHHSVKHESVPIRPASSDLYKAPSRSNPVKQTQAPKRFAEESTARVEVVDKSASINEPRSLKVRLKMGLDNLSTKKNVDIYNGLGLVSPSSSCDDSPTGGKWPPQDFQFPGGDSPNQIIRIMTSLPGSGSPLLSPLPEALAQLTEKLLRDNEIEPASRHNWGTSVLGSNGMTAKTLSVEDSMKAEGNNHLPPKSKKYSEKTLDDNLILKTQADFNTEACKELISEALKLPLLSDFHGTSRGKKDTLKQKSHVLSNAVRQEPLMPVLRGDDDMNEKKNGDDNLVVEVAHEERVHFQNDFQSNQQKDKDSRGEAANSSTKTDTYDFGSKSKKGLPTGHNNFQKQTNGKKSSSIEQERMKLPSRGEQLPPGGKKKQKGHFVGSLATEISNGSVKNVVSGHTDNSNAENHSCKKEMGCYPQQKDLTKIRDKYKEFFGDMIEDGDDLMDSPDEPSVDRIKTYQVSDKGLDSCESNSKERSSKGAHEQLISKVHPKGASDFTPPPQHVPPIGEPAHVGAPIEHWVQCDTCFKWRLLPFGTKEDSLPENWLCSMLNWLPGMNSCSITEEETTKAVARFYQPKNPSGFDGVLSEVNLAAAANDLPPKRSHQDIFPVGGREHGLKEVPNSKYSSKNKSLTIAVEPPLETEVHFQHSRNSSDPVMEVNHCKKKSKKKHHDNYYSNGGHSKSTKREGESEPNLGSAKASKKMKIEDEAWISTHEAGNELLIHNSNNGMLITGAQKYQPANLECSSRSSKGHTNDSLQISRKKLKFEAEISPDADYLDAKNDDNDDSNGVMKKRKAKGSLSTCSPSILSGKITNKKDETGQKEARLSMPEEKTSSLSRRNSKTDKKRKGTEDHQLGIDVIDYKYLKRELVSAATSSSSKVSDSQRSKSILGDVKSSPVESVSSSPFRTLDSERYPSGIKNVTEKDSFQNAGIMTKDNSIKFSDAKSDSGCERSSSMKKNLCENNNQQSVHDLKDATEGCLESDKVQIKHSAVLPSVYLAGDQADSGNHGNANGFFIKQSAMDTSRSKSKDKNNKLKSDSDKGRAKISETCDDLRDHVDAVKGEAKDIKMKFRDKSGCNADNVEVDIGSKKNPSGIMLDEQSKKDVKLKSVNQEATVAKTDAKCSLETASVAKKKSYLDIGEKRCRSDQDKEEMMKLDNGKEDAGNKNYSSNCGSRPYKGNGGDGSGVNVQSGGKGLKEQMSSKKSDMQNGIHFSASKHQLSNVHRLKDRDAPSPMRRDSHNQAAINALKEAKDLKHLADRLKNSGSADSTGFYFEAALKFLHGACLLESSGENSKRGDLMQSMQVYSSTAKLCEFCAHEYEKSKDLACAALAYKCMEVAYLRVTYSTHPTASRDRQELQTSLQPLPPGESPSSSASDIDNASNPATAEKAAQVRDGNSPQPAGNHVIAASSRPNFERLLKYMQDVNYAMEASRKSKGAFAAAKAAMKQADSKEGIGFVKRVLNFNFHDVDGLLRLVRVAVEAIKQ